LARLSETMALLRHRLARQHAVGYCVVLLAVELSRFLGVGLLQARDYCEVLAQVTRAESILLFVTEILCLPLPTARWFIRGEGCKEAVT
jgi:hypothetical protein